MPSARGTFITLEGVDGSGKSTQASLLVERLREQRREVVALREPGGTPISEKIRALLLDPENAEMADECELLLYEASRAQLVREVIEPALLRGAIVVCQGAENPKVALSVVQAVAAVTGLSTNRITVLKMK